MAYEKENWKREHSQEDQENFVSIYSKDELGTNTGQCATLLQPFYPNKALTSPQEILSIADQIRIGNYNIGQFPGRDLRPIQDGVMDFQWRPNGYIQCHQFYASGFNV